MPKRARSPSDKKRLSYERDGRSTYGENDKASRKAIPRFKAASNRAMRHNVKQIVSSVDGLPFDAADRRLADRTFRGLHPEKCKAPDQPLGSVVALKKEKRAGAQGAKARRRATQKAVPQ